MGETISKAIGADHQFFDTYYENIKQAQDDYEKVRWQNQLTWTIARHAIGEELTLYPAMKSHLGEEGVRLSKIDKEQHQEVENLVEFAGCNSKLTASTRSRTISTSFKARALLTRHSGRSSTH